MKADNNFLVGSVEDKPAAPAVLTRIVHVSLFVVGTRQDARVVTAGPVAAVEVAELPFPSQVRSSHLAEQNQVILLWKARSVGRVESAVLWVSLRNSAVLQPGR